MKFSNFLETDKREGGLLTFFLWKGGGGGSLESGALIEDLRYFTPMYTLCQIPVVRVQTAHVTLSSQTWFVRVHKMSIKASSSVPAP